MVSNGQDSRGKSKRGGKELKAKSAALPPEQNATAWAQRLGITDPKAMKAFIVDFLRLEPGYQGLPVPPPDASRCQLCRRKVFLDSKDKKECNGLCISGVKAKTILALRGQGKTIALGRTGGQHVTTYTAMSQHAREWHRRIGGGVDVQTFATFWASLPAEHRAVTAPAPEGELCPHCKKPVRLMRKVVWRGDNEARSRIKKDGKNLWDKQCDGPCNDKARAIILRSWIEAGHEFVELEDTSAAAPRQPPRRAAPKKKPPPAPKPVPAPPPAEVDLDACTLHVAEKEEEKRDASPRPQSRPRARRATQAAPKDWFQAPTRQEALDAAAESEPRRQRTGSAWSASSEKAAPAPSTRGLVVVCVGLPGAGKSTFFQKHFAAVPGIVRCSQDVLKSRQRVIDAVDAALQRGDAAFVDRTNVNKEQRAHWTRLAKRHGARCVALEFRTPADLCAHQCTTFNFAARLIG